MYLSSRAPTNRRHRRDGPPQAAQKPTSLALESSVALQLSKLRARTGPCGVHALGDVREAVFSDEMGGVLAALRRRR